MASFIDSHDEYQKQRRDGDELLLLQSLRAKYVNNSVYDSRRTDILGKSISNLNIGYEYGKDPVGYSVKINELQAYK